MISGEVLLAAITDACAGLIYVSEIDTQVAPFMTAVGAPLSVETVKREAGINKDAPANEGDFDAFFQHLCEVREWHGENEKGRAKSFLELFQLLKENLRSPKIYRIGKIRIDVFAVGLDAEQRVVGVRTAAVET